MIEKTLEQDDVKIRPINCEDTQLIINWRNSEEVRKHFIFRENFTKEMHESWMQNKVSKGKVAQFIIEKDGNPIGSVYLRDIDNTNKKAEFGIFMGSENSMGKGIGTLATRLILDYAFNTLLLHKVFLRVFQNNKRAIKSYEKVGFLHEGTFKDDVFLDGEFHNIVFMAITIN